MKIKRSRTKENLKKGITQVRMKKILILIFFIGFIPVIMAPAPTAQTLSAVSVTQTSAVLRGKVNPNGLSTDVDFCSCDPSASPSYFSPTPLKNIGSGNADVTVTQTLTGLTPGTTYSYCVRSKNSAGSQNGSCVSFTTTGGGGPPTATTLSATNITQTSAVLRGKVNPNGLSTDVDFCSCDPSASPSYFSPTPLKNIGSGNADVTVTQTLTGLTPGTTYSYCVRSKNSAGSQNGKCVTFTTTGGGGPPTATTLSATSITETSATLRGSVNPNGLATQIDFASCDLSTSPSYFSPTPLKNIGSGTSDVTVTHTLTGLTPGTTYQYVVRSINSAGSQNGKCVTFTTRGSGGGKGGSSTGSLRIYNTVSSYDIYIDGAYSSTALTSTVTIHNVPAGVHQIRLTKSGCQDVVETVTITAGSTASIHVSMVCGEAPTEGDDDGDGVTDSSDHCYNPDCNVVDSRGCPKDSDKDGINDCDDQCPTEKGPATNNGCTAGDRDNDGVQDDEDSCYNPDCAIVDSQGCPTDSDKDGINDCDDQCPTEYGEKRNNGCPGEDSDSDGITDDQDSCYNPGCTLVDSRGCPWDSDNDGLTDCEDNCPNHSGPRSNNGCPSSSSSTPSTDLTVAVILSLFVLTLVAIVGISLYLRKIQKKKAIPPKRSIKTVNCPHCGKKIEKTWMLCPHCGATLTEETRIYDDETRVY